MTKPALDLTELVNSLAYCPAVISRWLILIRHRRASGANMSNVWDTLCNVSKKFTPMTFMITMWNENQFIYVIWQKCSRRNLQQNYVEKCQIYSLSIDTLSVKMKFNFYRAMLCERGCATVSRLSVCPSVRLSVTLRYDFHIGWNSSKITSRPNSLRPLLWRTPTWAIWCNGNMGKFGGD